MVEMPEQAIQVLGQAITPETVREVIQKARAVRWGTHLLRWRYFDVQRQIAVIKIDREGWHV